MSDHTVHSAIYDEEWCVRCTCGVAFWSRYRSRAEDDQRRHMRLAGVQEARSSAEVPQGTHETVDP
jgi:hypothetical protein